MSELVITPRLHRTYEDRAEESRFKHAARKQNTREVDYEAISKVSRRLNFSDRGQTSIPTARSIR